MPKQFLERQANFTHSDKFMVVVRGGRCAPSAKSCSRGYSPCPRDKFNSGKKSDSWGSIRIEIGFGAGEHLLWQAKNNPEIEFIGSEVFLNGVASLVSGISKESIQNICLWGGMDDY